MGRCGCRQRGRRWRRRHVLIPSWTRGIRRHCFVASTDIGIRMDSPWTSTDAHCTGSGRCFAPSRLEQWSVFTLPLGVCVSVITIVTYIHSTAELPPRASIKRHLNREEKLQLVFVLVLAGVGLYSLRVIRTWRVEIGCRHRVCLVRMSLPNKAAALHRSA